MYISIIIYLVYTYIYYRYNGDARKPYYIYALYIGTKLNFPLSFEADENGNTILYNTILCLFFILFAKN